jgi:hypothetical protein
LKDEHRLSVFEKRALRMFGPKGDEMTGYWRKSLKGEFHNLQGKFLQIILGSNQG